MSEGGESADTDAGRPSSWGARGISLLVELRELVGARIEEDAAIAAWFRRWLPTVTQLVHVVRLARRALAGLAEAWGAQEASGPLVPPELVAELRASLEDLAVTFPGIAELMLGTTEIDRTLEAVLSDARGAEAISALTRHVERGLDAMVARVIDLLMTGGGPTDAEQEALSERLNEALVAAEAMLQRILDEWIYPQMWDDSGRPPRQTDR